MLLQSDHFTRRKDDNDVDVHRGDEHMINAEQLDWFEAKYAGETDKLLFKKRGRGDDLGIGSAQWPIAETH